MSTVNITFMFLQTNGISGGTALARRSGMRKRRVLATSMGLRRSGLG